MLFQPVTVWGTAQRNHALPMIGCVAKPYSSLSNGVTIHLDTEKHLVPLGHAH